MPRNLLTRRLAALAVATGMIAAACGDDGDTNGDESAPTSAPAPTTTNTPDTTDAIAATTEPAPSTSASGSPIELAQTTGELTIDQTPAAVYALTNWSLDFLTGLGVTPVGAATFTPPSSWIDGPEVDNSAIDIALSEGLPLEQIAAANPDLIVDIAGFYTFRDPDADGLLGEIAPTLAPPTEPVPSLWRDSLRHIATALDLADEADAQIADTDALLAAVIEETPELDGAAIAFVRYNPDQQTFDIVAGEQDFSRAFLNQDLGFTTPSAQLDAAAEGNGLLSVGLENVELVGQDADAVLLFVAGDPTALDSEPVWQNLDVVSDGRVVTIDGDGVNALRTPTPRAIEWLVDNVLPQLATAVS